MGMFTFLKGKGDPVLKADKNKADSVKQHVIALLERQNACVDNLAVEFEDGTVTLSGQCNTNKTREKAILMAGNIEGVERVNADGLLVPQAAPESPIPTTPVQGDAPPSGKAEPKAAVQEPAEAPTRKIVPSERVAEATQSGPESQFYTIQSGDTLSKIAKEFYGDPNKYPFIVEENTGVITNPDKIYPGQVIRIPPMSVA